MSLDAVFGALLLALGAGIYYALVRQIQLRPATGAFPGLKQFGLPEAVFALLLAGLFLYAIFAAVPISDEVRLGPRQLLFAGGSSLGIFGAIALGLALRGFNLSAIAGFNKFGFGKVLSTGAVLLFAAYPLVVLADTISKRILGSDSPRQQEIIEMFRTSDSSQERLIIIALAVAIAPLAEEWIFRFFLYGVLRRYLGRAPGLLVNALLFAAVHVHLPAFLPLFVLGSCFTIAFEWSGSILVPMTMHALFNTISLAQLAFPTLAPR